MLRVIGNQESYMGSTEANVNIACRYPLTEGRIAQDSWRKDIMGSLYRLYRVREMTKASKSFMTGIVNVFLRSSTNNSDAKASILQLWEAYCWVEPYYRFMYKNHQNVWSQYQTLNVRSK